jgi:aminoglycoside 6'-N-acetyltransferase I
MHLRACEPRDELALAQLRHALWPDGSIEEHRAEVRAFLNGETLSTLPLATFIAEQAGSLIGFVDVSVRSHADGCDPRHPVGFIEGWYVQPAQQRQGVGRALIEAAERWSRAQGCREMASDSWIDREVSHRAHDALGYEVVDRCVHYRKTL